MRKWIFYPVLASAGFVLPVALMHVATAEAPKDASASAGEAAASPQAMDAGAETDPADLQLLKSTMPSNDAELPKAAAPSTANGAPKTPSVSAAPAAKALEPEEYVVKPGDTLGEIAREQLGSVEAWPQIAKLNGIEHPEALAVGTRLKLPSVN